jgi:ribosomal protein S6--L-glutamate ligase
VQEIALRCGRIFGLGLYGLDVIEGPTGPVVIDLNYFPSYKGMPDAAALLARYILDDAATLGPGSLSSAAREAARSGIHLLPANYTPAHIG